MKTKFNEFLNEKKKEIKKYEKKDYLGDYKKILQTIKSIETGYSSDEIETDIVKHPKYVSKNILKLSKQLKSASKLVDNFEKKYDDYSDKLAYMGTNYASQMNNRIKKLHKELKRVATVIGVQREYPNWDN